jgi:hypothetical protein
MAAPKLVCMAYDDGEREEILLREEAIQKFRRWIHDPDVILVGQSVAYDLGVLIAEDFSLAPMICAAIEAGRIKCTKLREKIIAIAKGELKFEWDEDLHQWKKTSFDLNRLLYRRTGEFHKKKDDPWQLRFGELDGIPVAWWPQGDEKSPGPAAYVLGDIRKTKIIFESQEEETQPEGIPGETLEVKADFALNIMRIWGVRTDPEAVAKFEAEIRRDYEAQVKIALNTCATDDCGCDKTEPCDQRLMRITSKGPSKKMAAIRGRIEQHYDKHGMAIAYTAGRKNKKTGVRTPEIATDREQLLNRRNKDVPRDPGLVAISEVGRLGKLLTTYCKILHRGTHKPITPGWNTPLDSFRTSCADPNLQNGPRASAFRPCFIPRQGWVFVFCDYDTIEMRTLAQTCIDFGFDSELAAALNADKDVHVDLAADMLGIDYDEAIERYEAEDPMLFGANSSRQYSKIGNYGLGGGMGPEAFRDYARGYDIDLSIEQCLEIHQGFRRKWGEMPQYFAHCSALCELDGGEVEYLVHPRTGLVRGKVRYTATCNHFFQHLAAIGAKSALWAVVKETIAVPDSPLYGCRAWLFNHDEIGLEVPFYWWGVERSHAAVKRLQEVMIAEMKKWVPDIKIGASPVMVRRWYKGAKPVKQGLYIVPGKPVKKTEGDKEKTVWVADLDGLVPEAMAA